MNHNCQFSKKLTVKTFIFAVGCLVLFVIALPTDGTSFAGESPEIPKLSSNTEEVSYGSDTWKLDGRAALGTTVALTEQYLKHSLTSLRLIAQSPATRSGIWPQIRPGLAALKEAIPGAALYIEPDGNYYSVEKGYTRLNLSDREYFGPLFRGEEVHGSLIYSRSTGKQSVIMAVPVFEEEEVTGAVALSIFLDDFQQLISDALNLPSDYLWYVLDEEGSTVLHPRSDFVFMNPARQGSPSLTMAAETIISEDYGHTSYVFGGRNTHILFQKLSFNDWRVVFGKIGEEAEDMHMPEAYDILESLTSEIKGILTDMDSDLDKTVQSFEGSFPPEHTARNAFRSVYKDNPYVVSCALIDTDGVITYIEPAEFHSSEGKNIRDQENFLMMQKNRAPLLSNSFLAVEGFDAVSLQHPIIDDQGGFHGSVSILIRPDVMIEELATPFVAETIYEPWVMEPSGRIIFDKAFGGTGRMLFLDYRFEEQRTLLELGDKIEENESGHSDFIFYDEATGSRKVKMALWDTIRLYDAAWRIIVSYPPYE